jgi:DNA-binding NarL/FixJ family response regulator
LDEAACKSLLGVALAADSLAARWSADPRSLDDRLRELGRLARQAVSETRCVINDLRDDLLGNAVRSVVTAWGILAGVGVRLAVPRVSEATEDIRREVVAILRAALLNVEQHARASEVRVSLQTGDGLFLVVADNGAGFSPSARLEEFRSVPPGGLAIMRERARRLGGNLVIRSGPGHGTRVEVQIPAPELARQQLRAAPPVRVVVAESNPILRFGLRAVLEQAPVTEVVAEAASGSEAAEQVRLHDADVLLLDARITLPDGPATIRQIGRLAQVVMLTWPDDAGSVMPAVAAGACGYVIPGEFEPGELIRVVLEAARRKRTACAAGERAQPAALAAAGRETGADTRMLRPRGREAGSGAIHLRPREREIMQLIADGMSNRQIAARLVISEKTVKNHICSIYQRLGAHGRIQAISRWLGS